MVLGILASWEERRAAKRAAQQAIARSDEIDCQIENDSKIMKQRNDVLLMGSCISFIWYYILSLGLIFSLY